MRPVRCLGLLAVMAGLLWGASAAAAEQFPTGPNHRGITAVEPYSIFPENRPGNGVYLNNQLVFESPAGTLVDLLALPAEGRFVYYTRGPQGRGSLGAFLRAGEPAPRIDEVSPGFFHATLSLDGVVHKKMLRIVEQRIQDLLPYSRTPDGPVAGPVGVVFYHVASNIREEGEGGEPRTAFGLRLHLALFDDERPRHLDYTIVNRLPQLKVRWVDSSRIEVELADGRTEMLSVAQFQ